jgi:outer membrane protein TolC
MSRRARPSSAVLALIALGTAGRAAAQAPVPTATPAPAAPPVSMLAVTWQEALDRAVARNPSAVVAQQEITRAEALIRQARAGWLPTIGATGIYTRLDSNRVLNNAVVTPINQYGGTLSASVPLIAPQAWANDWHAQDNREVTARNAAEVGRQLAASVGRAYLTVLLQHRQVEVAARALETARAHYQYAHTRLAGGVGNSIDDARSEQEARTDEAQLAAARSGLVRAQSALAILLSEDRLVDVREEVPLPAAPAPDAAVDEARQRRTDVQVARARLTASQHLRRDTWVYYAPSLIAMAQALAGTHTAVQPARGWQAQIVLSIPLFDGGLRYGIGRERRVLEEESRVQLDAALRQVSVEVRAGFESLQQADEGLRAAQAAVRAADSAAKLAEQAYRAGATTNLELVDAERRARDAATQAALAEDAARQARLDVLVASGRFP